MCTSKKDDRNGTTITDANGNQYFIFGKSKIKITEHFTDNGKPIDLLLFDLIQAKIKENITKTA